MAAYKPDWGKTFYLFCTVSVQIGWCAFEIVEGNCADQEKTLTYTVHYSW